MKQEIQALLKTGLTVGDELLYFEELDSTNTYGKNAALAGAPDGMAIIADHQTAGRGRQDRTFLSPKGKGLYMTVLLQPGLTPERLPSMTTLAGVAVCAAVERVCGIRPGIKWPNDLVLGGKKLCGILTELVMRPTGDPCVVIGIGINVSQRAEDFTAEVAEIATSLWLELGKSVSRAVLAAAVLEELDQMYCALKTGDLMSYLEFYRRNCVNLGKHVQLLGLDGQRETVLAMGIDQDFGLVVRTAAGEEKTVRSGEVSVRGLYGYVE